MRYRKKPVEIEAFRLGIFPVPVWFKDKVSKNEIILHNDLTADINTLEGVMHANYGDFIIKGVAGEIYPCKPDIFIATYEAVDESNIREDGVYYETFAVKDGKRYNVNVVSIRDAAATLTSSLMDGMEKLWAQT